MRHLPLFAALRDRDCLVVGGGVVAERRARLLLEAGARVTVLAPEISAGIEALAQTEPRLTLSRAPFSPEVVDAYWLAVAATSVPDVNAAVAAAAERAKRFCNVVDDPVRCSFIMPAIVDRNPVTIAISSGGASPVLTRWVKGVVESLLPQRLGALAELAAAWRARVRAALPDAVQRRRFWERVVTSRIADQCFAGAVEAAEEALGRALEAEREAPTPTLPSTSASTSMSASPETDGGEPRGPEGPGVEQAGRSLEQAGRSLEQAGRGLEQAGRSLEQAGFGRQRATGEAWLVGAGPGRADLITLRGRQLLAAADVVLYDRLASRELLKFARRDAELIDVGKVPRESSITQPEINRLLVDLVMDGKRVCRLKGGDPLVFGRGGEEIEALVEAGLPFQIVPGVSAVEGCAAYAGIPLTLRDLSQAVIIATGHTKDHEAADLASFRPGQTLALYMGVGQYEAVRAELVRAGHAGSTPAAIVERGTTDAQRVICTTLGRIAEARDRFKVRSPALLLVGPTAALAERYAWFAPGRLEVFDERGGDALAHVS